MSTEYAKSEETPQRIYLISYPKIIFLYPTFIAALVAAIYMNLQGNAPLDITNKTAVMLASVFLGVFTINLVVFSFEFPRSTSLTLFFFIAAVVLSFFLMFQYRPDWLPVMKMLVGSFHPLANATFYNIFCGVLAFLFIGVLCNRQFDYWEVRPNELLHHHGILSNLERYAAPNLRISKEINDVFEYMLLRSGRLILQPGNEPRAIVLENVLFIGKKEEALTKMLSALQVRVSTADEPS